MSQSTTSQNLDFVISQVEQMILIAKQFGGAAFGGYVRDVVIRRKLMKLTRTKQLLLRKLATKSRICLKPSTNCNKKFTILKRSHIEES